MVELPLLIKITMKSTLIKPSVAINFAGIVLWTIGFVMASNEVYPAAWYVSMTGFLLLVIGLLVWAVRRFKLVKYALMILRGRDYIRGRRHFSVKEELKEFAISTLVQGLAFCFLVWAVVVFGKRFYYMSTDQFEAASAYLEDRDQFIEGLDYDVSGYGLLFKGDLNFAGGGVLEFTALTKDGKDQRVRAEITGEGPDGVPAVQVNVL